jgi:hypothetical protein
MNIIEAFQIYALESTPGDGRWISLEASSTEVLVNVNGRTSPVGVTEARKLRAVLDHFIAAEEVTEASTLGAIAAEFEE